MNSERKPLLSSPLFATLLILAAIAVCYGRVTRGPFLFDDYPHIVDNPAIRSWTNFGEIWKSLPSRFVPMLSFALNFEFGRLDPFGYHIVNLSIHALAGLLVYLIVRTLFFLSSAPKNRFSEGVAIFSGLLFIVHPVQTQAVNYVIQRMASLGTVFYLAALLAYLWFRNFESTRPSEGFRLKLVSLALTVLALFTKEFSLSLPLAMALADFIFFPNEPLSKKFRRLLPWAFAALAFTLVIFGLAKTPAQSIPRESSWFLTYWMTQFHVFFRYIELIFWPVSQNLDYVFPLTRRLDIELVFRALAIFSLFILSFRFRRRNPVLAFGALFYFVGHSVEAAAPVIDVIFEHRLYLPMAGVCIAMAGIAIEVTRIQSSSLRRAGSLFSLGAGTGTLVACCLLTIARNGVWTSAESIWRDVVQKAPTNGRAHGMLGRALADRGKLAEAEKEILTALDLLRHDQKQSQRFNLFNLSLNSFYMGKLDQAARYALEANELYPHNPKTLSLLARIHLRTDRKQAPAFFKKALEFDSRHVAAHTVAAEYSLLERDFAQGFLHAVTALQSEPNYFPAKVLLARNLAGQGRKDEAARILEELEAAALKHYSYPFELSKAFDDLGNPEKRDRYRQLTMKRVPEWGLF